MYDEKEILKLFFVSTRYLFPVKISHSFQNWVNLPCHDFFNIVPRLLDAMVCDAIL